MSAVAVSCVSFPSVAPATNLSCHCIPSSPKSHVFLGLLKLRGGLIPFFPEVYFCLFASAGGKWLEMDSA